MSSARAARWSRSRAWLSQLLAWMALLSHEGATPGGGELARDVTQDIERWFGDYQRPILDHLYGMTRDREWAADLTQETFLRAYAARVRDSAAIERIENPQAWLYRIATNLTLSALRRNRRFAWLPLSAVEESGDTGDSSEGRWRVDSAASHGEDIAATVVERDAVWRALAGTPPRWRAALLLQTAGGFTPREIAGQLGVSEANARKMLYRAKERFRQIMRDMARADAAAETKGGAR